MQDEDYGRGEIEIALQREIPVLPVLIGTRPCLQRKHPVKTAG